MKNSTFWADQLDAYKRQNFLRTDAALAENLGVSRSMISHIRAGRERAPVQMRLALLDALGYGAVENGALGAVGALLGEGARASVEAGLKKLRGGSGWEVASALERDARNGLKREEALEILEKIYRDMDEAV